MASHVKALGWQLPRCCTATAAAHQCLRHADTVVSNGAHTDRLSNADIFWNKQEADLGDGKVITGKTWPQVRAHLATCAMQLYAI